MDVAQEKVREVHMEVQDALRKLRLSLLVHASPLRAQAGRMENVWILAWLIRDLGWALYCWPVAWSAALIALVLQSHDVLQQWDSAPISVLVHNLATLAWLCGSSVWMSAQLLFETEVHKSRASPWYSGAIVSASPMLYQAGLYLMQVIDIAALIGVLAYYATHAKKYAPQLAMQVWAAPDSASSGASSSKPAHSDSEPSSAGEPAATVPRLVFGFLTQAVYSKIFIVPLIIKDLFCTTRSFIPAIICMFMVIVLMADYLFLFMHWKNLAVLLWGTGNAVWIAHDLVMHDQEIWPLLLAVLLFVVGACILGATLVARPPRFDSSSKQGSSLDNTI